MRELPKKFRTSKRLELRKFLLEKIEQGYDLDDDNAVGLAVFIREQDIEEFKKYVNAHPDITSDDMFEYMDKLAGVKWDKPKWET